MTDRGSFGMHDPASSSFESNGPHDFTRLSQAIGNNIQKINGNVNQMHSLLNSAEMRQDPSRPNDRLQQVQHYTNQLAKDTNRLIKEINQLSLALSPSEQKQQRIQKERLVNEFTKALNSFQSVQRQEKEREKADMMKAKATSSKSSFDPFADSRLSFEQSSEIIGFRQPQQQSMIQIEASDVDLELMSEREESLRKLERDITDVNQIFKDLGMMVHEQGEVIDSIEANVESASVHVEQGTEQLRQAKEYQTKARKKKCIIITVLLVIVAIIIIVLVAVYAPKGGQ